MFQFLKKLFGKKPDPLIPVPDKTIDLIDYSSFPDLDVQALGMTRDGWQKNNRKKCVFRNEAGGLEFGYPIKVNKGQYAKLICVSTSSYIGPSQHKTVIDGKPILWIEDMAFFPEVK